MNIRKTQKDLELAHSAKFKTAKFDIYEDELIGESLLYLVLWLDKQKTLFEPDRKDIEEIHNKVDELYNTSLLWDIYKLVLSKSYTSFAEIFARFERSLEGDTKYRQAKILEPFINALLSNKEYFELSYNEEGFLSIKLLKQIEVPSTYNSYILPSLLPKRVKDNNHAGYRHENFHVITGNPLNKHDKEVCLDHINRMNSTAFSLDNRVEEVCTEKFDAKYKYLPKKDRYETLEELQARYGQFILTQEERICKIKVLEDLGNKFYFHSRYDNRGRSYIKAHHLDYIGSKWVRAKIHLFKKSFVTGGNKYGI